MNRENIATNISVCRLEELQRSPFPATGLVWQLGKLGFELRIFQSFSLLHFLPQGKWLLAVLIPSQGTEPIWLRSPG